MSTENLVLKWGIVACGKISNDFCTALLTLKSDKQKLQACAARDLNAAKSFAEKFGISNFYNSYDSVFSDKDVNIVYIGSLHTSHKELSIKALNAGKHVLCEKPMAMNSKEQEEVLAASKANNKFFMEALWTRHFPSIARLKQELRCGTIGDLKFFTSNFMVPIKEIDRMKLKELGGGAIYDIGIYPIQLACLAFDHEKPIKITATGHLMDTGVDESCSITLLFSGGRFAVINMSTITTMYAPTHLVGDKGVMQIPHFSWCPSELILPNGEVAKFPYPECAETNFQNSVGLRYQAESAYEAISNGWIEHPYVTHDHSRLICQIMDEARKQLGNTLPSDL